MPFTIKASYHGQMRKLKAFHPTGLPTWDELTNEIQHVFWRAENFGIARVQIVDRFVPEPINLNEGRFIMDSLSWDMQVRCAVEGRDDLSAGAVLKFDVLEIPEGMTPVKQAEPMGSNSPAVANAPTSTSVAPESCICMATTAATATPKNEQCCSVSKAKRDVQEMLKKFTADFESLTVDFKEAIDVDSSDDEGKLPSPPVRSTPLPHERKVQIMCDGCDKEIVAKRWKCETCPNFDFCDDCYNMNTKRFRTYGHPHSFRAASLTMGAAWSAAEAEHTGPMNEANDKPAHNAYCNLCFRTICGVRHKCTDCSDYDLCSACVLQRSVVHQPEHTFVTIRDPGEVVMWDLGNNNGGPDIIRAFNDDAPVLGPEVTIHPATCDVCEVGIVGVRYKCLDCPDYDLCALCLPNRKEQHDPSHHFLYIDRPTNIVKHIVKPVIPDNHQRRHRHAHRRGPAGGTPVPMPVPVPVSAPMAAESAVRPVHPATCDLCSSKIIGVRYKCANCPDYDTCESCFTITEEQHPQHSFIRIADPTDYIQRSHSSGRRMPSHKARCNACNARIPSSGPRYKCTHPSCPDFDLCPNCEAQPFPVHPVEHILLKLRVPASMVEPREAMPNEARDDPVEHPACCDYCGLKITGIRYKCAECDNFDLCQACESLPTSHNRAHVLLKMRQPMYAQNHTWRREPRTTASNNPFESPEDAGAASIAESETLIATEPEKPIVKNMTQRSASSVFLNAFLNPEPTNTPPAVDPTVASTPKAVPELRGIFLEDLSIPDGHPLPPNSHFIKRWRLVNPGPQEWPAGTELGFTGGDPMGAPSSVTVGPVQVGEEKIVEVEMQAGTTEGKHVGFWSLAHNGNVFGHRLWVEIEVVNLMNASMNASAFGAKGSGSSLDSSVIVMPAAPSVAGSAAEAEEPASPISEAPHGAVDVEVESDAEESSHALSSNISIVSLSEEDEEDEEWNEAMAAPVEHGRVQAPEVDDGWAEVADTLERESLHAHADADAEDAALRDRTGYVLVYDETDEE